MAAVSDYANQAKDVEEQLKALGLNVKVRVEIDYPIVNLLKGGKGRNKTKSIQVREESHVAVPALVKQYLQQMKHGAKFPPPVVTEDGYMVDGNNRGSALIQLNEKNPAATTVVLMIEAKYDTLSDPDKLKIQAYAGYANQKGGQRLTNSEAIELAKRLKHQFSWTSERLAEHLGVDRRIVTSAVAEFDAEVKMQRAGVSSDQLNATQKRALGRDKVTSINDKPYAALAQLVADSGLPAKDIQVLSETMRKAGSDEAAIAEVEQMRDKLRNQIAQRKLTGHGTPPPSSRILRHLAAIKAYKGKEIQLVEATPEHQQHYAAELTETVEVLQAVLAAQAAHETGVAA